MGSQGWRVRGGGWVTSGPWMEIKGGRAGHGHSQGVEIEGGRQVMALLWVEIDRGREGHEWPMGGGQGRKGVSWVGHGWRLAG